MKASLHKDSEEKMHVYEVGLVLMPSLSEESAVQKMSSIRGMLEKARCAIISEDSPKLMPLAYQMDKTTDAGKQIFSEAYYSWIKFEAPVEVVSAIEKEISAVKEVIRFLIVKTLRDNVLNPEKVAGAIADDVASRAAKKSSEEEIEKSIDALVIG